MRRGKQEARGGESGMGGGGGGSMANIKPTDFSWVMWLISISYKVCAVWLWLWLVAMKNTEIQHATGGGACGWLGSGQL
jgi:hypothetical protein